MPTAHSWPEVLSALIAGVDLSTGQSAWAMSEILSAEASPSQIAGFAVALRAKGETPGELSGLVEAMLANATVVDLPEQIRGDAVDVVGTGGDQAHTVNISTMAAIVTAAAGVKVVKHGNRAASSACGTADLLEHFGIPLDLGPDGVAATVAEAGIAFCFAPVFHPAMRHTAVPRRDLGVATVFNILGPLTNPARPASQAVGVSDARLAPVMAGVLAARGADALVFRGDDGLDELTTTGTSTVWTVSGGSVSSSTFDPLALGVPRASLADLRGGDAALNASVVRELLAGKPGPVRDAVLLNAAAAVAAFRATEGSLTDRLADGLAAAGSSLDSGAAAAVLDRWVSVSQGLGG